MLFKIQNFFELKKYIFHIQTNRVYYRVNVICNIISVRVKFLLNKKFCVGKSQQVFLYSEIKQKDSAKPHFPKGCS